MQPLSKTWLSKKYNWLVSGSVFISAYLFLVFAVNTELIYYYFQMRGKTGDFRTGAEYFFDSFSYPGGPSQYLAALLTQLCYFPWLGPVFLILIGWLLYRLTVSLLNISSEKLLHAVCYLPALLILMKCVRYENPFSSGLAILIAVLVSVIYQKIYSRIGWLKYVLFLLLTAAFYYICGIDVLIFVLIAALFELFEQRRPVSGIVFALIGIAVCLLTGVFVFRLDDGDSVFSLIHFAQLSQFKGQEDLSKLLDIALLAFFPLIFLIVSVVRLPSSKIKDTGTKNMKRENKMPVWEEKPTLKWLIQPALIIIICILALLFVFDRQTKRVLQINYFANRKMWTEVLSVARKGPLKKYFPYCTTAVNRALIHTGRLGDEMLTFPQKISDYDLVFNRHPKINVSYLERPQLCLELGIINAAETIAYNFLPTTGGNPYTIEQIAMINLIKGQIETARIYLNALACYPVYRSKALKILAQIEKDPSLDGDQYIKSIRKNMVENEFAFAAFDEELWLKELLRKNKNHKMAFEYLMAHYLLDRQLDKFIENLPRLDDFGYKNIPRHYQEAILVYKGITQKDVDLAGRVLDADVVNQFEKISEIVNDPANSNFDNLKRKLAPLAPKFGNTYFFYYIFGSNEKT